ncbi:MAG: hypothetical protein ASARMPRED_005372 [Alectoria sarmentosa]|nr:MAG: hypothetical protein ASARMPRED_005372 [Alectoria sarmentosa]
MGLFDSSSSSSSKTCPSITTGPQYGTDYVVGSLTFHNLTIVLCGAFTAATFLFSGAQLLLHATHFSNPAQQTQILRIVALVPTFALVYFLAGFVPSAAVYLQPWADAYEAVALTSYFLLLVTYTAPDPQRRDGVFDRLLQPGSGEGSLKWYRRTWIFVFQYIPISFIVAVATDITQATGTYCVNGHGVHFAHIWLTVIHTISVMFAFLRLLQFYRRLRTELKEHRVKRKLFAIKGIVFLSTLQTFLFAILSSTGAVEPSATLSYNDFYFGIPSILICGEMVLFSMFNFYAYSVKPYTLSSSSFGCGIESQASKGGARYRGGFLGIDALLAAVNPMEIARGLVLAIGIHRFRGDDAGETGEDSDSSRKGEN